MTVTPEIHKLDVPGASLHYEVRRPAEPSARPPVLLIGCPMDSTGFVTLASHLTDRVVVTYDPRGTGNSTWTDPVDVPKATPQEHADDVRRLIEAAVGTGTPVDLFATSGGAVNALVLVATHPDLLRTLVAHEPPAATALPDRDAVLAAAADRYETYMRDGQGPAMAKFIAFVMEKGEITMDYLDRPAPDPAAFGLPTDDDGRRDDPLLGQNAETCLQHEHDYAALRAAGTRIVPAVGVLSLEEMTGRCTLAVAEHIGVPAVEFPSHHAGFLGDDVAGMQGEPEAFAAKLREVLDED